MHRIVSNDGAMVGRADIVQNYNSIVAEDQRRRQVWQALLMSQDIRIAHPYDGWVNQDQNRLRPMYPTMYHDAKVGDLIVLGTPSRWRYARVTGLHDNYYYTTVNGESYRRSYKEYFFEEMYPGTIFRLNETNGPFTRQWTRKIGRYYYDTVTEIVMSNGQVKELNFLERFLLAISLINLKQLERLYTKFSTANQLKEAHGPSKRNR